MIAIVWGTEPSNQWPAQSFHSIVSVAAQDLKNGSRDEAATVDGYRNRVIERWLTLACVAGNA